MRGDRFVTAALLCVCATALAVGLYRAGERWPGGASGLSAVAGFPGGPGVGLVEISGVIAFGDGDGGPFSVPTPAERALWRLRRFRSDERVRAVVVWINSPGGSLAASQALYREMARLRQSGKPVVVSMSDVAASGGYYVALAADRIYALPGTVTASIGVITVGFSLKELMERYGVKVHAFTSGKNKDTLAFWRDPRPDEVERLGELVQRAYAQFFDLVVERRGVDRAALQRVADGRILLGAEAEELGLVDEIGDLEDAVRAAAELAGLDPDGVRLIRGPASLFEILRLEFPGALARALRPTSFGAAPYGSLLGAARIAYLYPGAVGLGLDEMRAEMAP